MKKTLFLMFVVFPQCVFAEDKKLEYFYNTMYLISSEYIVQGEYFEAPTSYKFLEPVDDVELKLSFTHYRPGETSWMRQLRYDKGIALYRDMDQNGYGHRFLLKQLKTKDETGKTRRIVGVGVEWRF